MANQVLNTGAAQTPAPAKPKSELGDMLQDPKYKTMLLQAATGTPLNIDRFIRIMSTAVMKNPTLQRCTASSMFGSLMVLASVGLEPNTPLQHAYIIPYKRSFKDANDQWQSIYEAQPQIGYRGYIALARRSGGIINIHPDIVFEGDIWDYEYGSNQHLKHIPKLVAQEGRLALAGYCHAKLTNGETFEVLPIADVDKYRMYSQSYRQVLAFKDSNNAKDKQKYLDTPWVKNENAMRKKTMVLRLTNTLPMATAAADAAMIERALDNGVVNVNDFSSNNIKDIYNAAAEAAANSPQEEEETYDRADRSPSEAAAANQAAAGEQPKRRGRGPAKPKETAPATIENQPQPTMAPMDTSQQQAQPVAAAQPAQAAQQQLAAQPAQRPAPAPIDDDPSDADLFGGEDDPFQMKD